MSSRAASGRRRLQTGNTSPSKSKSKPLKATNAASTGGHFEKSFLAALRPLRPTGAAQAPLSSPPSPSTPSATYAPGVARQEESEERVPPPSLVFSDQPRSPLGLVSPPLSSGSNNTALSPLRKGDNVYLPSPPPPPLESRSGSSDSGSVTSIASSHSSMNVNAPTSYFSHSSGSTDSQPTPSPSAFVFPSSRSRAHPSSPPPKFKLKSKKDKGKQVETQVYPVASSSSRHPSPEPAASNIGSSGSSSNSKSLYSHNSTEGESSFVFPSSRSRAHPSSPPPKLKLPLKKKSKSSTGSRQSDSHRRFMGIPLNRKKKPSQDQSQADIGSDFSDPSSPRSSSVDTASFIGSTSFSIDPPWTPTSSPSKRDSYPLDPYDSILLEQDRLGTELLKRLNSVDGPSFHHYGNNPPATVLDLGCGEGHWMLDAAVAWKGYGTKVTGFDMVDITKSLRTAAARNGVSENISFVKGNFLKNGLPFANDSFDLVRMSNLTYAISFEKWEFVLREACRVLTVGGRLELIDDHVFFPYGKSALPMTPLTESSDADSLARYSQLHPDSDRVDPITEEENDYDIEEEASDTATLNGRRHGPTTSTDGPSHSVSSSLVPAEFYADPWTDQASAARELESLFEHLQNTKYGIHLCPSQFVVEMLQEIFGHSREVRTMHLTLASPDPVPEKGRPPDDIHQLTHAPGLMLWPSTLIPLPRTEIEVHALKHPRVLLSLKAALTSYAVEIAEEDEVDEEVVKESLWDYEGFLHERFNPPQYIHAGPQGASYTRQDSDGRSMRGSILSIGSVSSEGQSAMQEYQHELREHLAWSFEDTRVSPPPRPHIPHPHDNSHVRTVEPSILTLPSFATVNPTDAAAPPNYSRYEPTHVRTFHVFEAIKMDETLLGAAI
ncbi:hypothetical protein IW261DRAFT_1413546 [Armillaria novae-zelandiae]|uniref:Methyltransferase domain-containing protein n=1 Tax=Armillaria novae-zelandiae TaxID=153914 RepID=A0AA39TIY7_9AGAR|nr:hypothetical protein IW261DRAFT_1413546 [Armillaria novae-zelandiae]